MAAHSATGITTGVLGESLTSLLTINSTHTNPGIYTDSWSFAGNANYFASTGTFTDTIIPTIRSVSTTTASGTYDAGKVISITINFNGPVFVTGTPNWPQFRRHCLLQQRKQHNRADLHLHGGRRGQRATPGLHRHDRLDASLGSDDPGRWQQQRRADPPGHAGFQRRTVRPEHRDRYRAPTVSDFRVIFGGKSYSLIGLGRDLPWQITGIQVSFSEPVTASTSSLAGSGIAVASLSGSGTSTLTWTLSTGSPLSLGSFSGSACHQRCQWHR